MSDLRIRSETVFDDDWAQPFMPPACHADHRDHDDDVDFAPLLTALDRSLTRLFGLIVTVTPARPLQRVAGECLTRVDPLLSGLLATLRMGGDPGRAGTAVGIVQTRYALMITEAIDAVAATVWPRASVAALFEFDVRCEHSKGVIEARALLVPPPRPPLSVPQPVAALRLELLALPLRVRVELAADMRMIASLLPLRSGQVLAITPNVEMPMIVGRHRIGRVSVAAQSDGRQIAEIIAIGIEPVGECR